MKHKKSGIAALAAALLISIPFAVFASSVEKPVDEAPAAEETVRPHTHAVREEWKKNAAAQVEESDGKDTREFTASAREAQRLSAVDDNVRYRKLTKSTHKLTGENSVADRVAKEGHLYQTQTEDDFLVQTVVYHTSADGEVVSAYVDFDMLYSGVLDFSPTAQFTCYSQLVVTYGGGKTVTLTNRSTEKYTASACAGEAAYYGYSYNLAPYRDITRIVCTMRLDLVSNPTTGQYYPWYLSRTKDQIMAQDP